MTTAILLFLQKKIQTFNEEKLLERLDQAILDIINNPKKIKKTARIGTLI